MGASNLMHGTYRTIIQYVHVSGCASEGPQTAATVPSDRISRSGSDCALPSWSCIIQVDVANDIRRGWGKFCCWVSCGASIFISHAEALQ